ncbi:unnamed protein product [Cylicocyclus nassatus]|uniref:Uncharacterized protein n=1 Tax=Cylicocyclus nassatus TaxID=53992 RepID=A0AA36MEK6_CYLNA|nr:unnamed protein product [Cylicocyclus nassatus]
MPNPRGKEINDKTYNDSEFTRQREDAEQIRNQIRQCVPALFPEEEEVFTAKKRFNNAKVSAQERSPPPSHKKKPCTIDGTSIIKLDESPRRSSRRGSAFWK